MAVLADHGPDHISHPGHLLRGQVKNLAEHLIAAPLLRRGLTLLEPALVALVLQPPGHHAQFGLDGRVGGVLRECQMSLQW